MVWYEPYIGAVDNTIKYDMAITIACIAYDNTIIHAATQRYQRWYDNDIMNHMTYMIISTIDEWLSVDALV